MMIKNKKLKQNSLLLKLKLKWRNKFDVSDGTHATLSVSGPPFHVLIAQKQQQSL